MANYLLLRDNKETGPFSLEELIKYGLKPYDLVWVAGKSAAWRYPSELNELKPYAPTVEEQPFDRFYKKTSQEDVEQPALEAAAQASATVNDQYQAYAPKVEAEPVKPAARKSVFVTMPGQMAASTQKAAVKPAPVPKPVPAAIPDYTLSDVEETISVSEKQVAKVKYSQPLEEIKEMYVKTLKDRKDRIARKGFLKVSVKRAAVVVGLISVGVLAGFILKSRPAQNSNLAQQLPAAGNTLAVNNQAENVAAPPDQPAGADVETIPSDNPAEQALPAENKTASPKPNSEKYSSTVPVEANNVQAAPVRHDSDGPGESKKPLAMMSASDAKKTDKDQHEYVPSEVNSSTGERTRSARNTLNEMTIKAATENTNNSSPAPVSSVPDHALSGLGSQVSVVSNDYKRVALGGIRNLELTVTNRSKYALDEVAVELQYFKPNDQVLKTQVVQFKSVGANESETLRIPDTNRGVKVQFKIIRIGSSQLADR